MESLLTWKLIYWDSLITSFVLFVLGTCVFISPPSCSNALHHASSMQSHSIEHQMVKMHVTAVEVESHSLSWYTSPDYLERYPQHLL
jgi:hypothetical protein